MVTKTVTFHIPCPHKHKNQVSTNIDQETSPVKHLRRSKKNVNYYWRFLPKLHSDKPHESYKPYYYHEWKARNLMKPWTTTKLPNLCKSVCVVAYESHYCIKKELKHASQSNVIRRRRSEVYQEFSVPIHLIIIRHTTTRLYKSVEKSDKNKTRINKEAKRGTQKNECNMHAYCGQRNTVI